MMCTRCRIKSSSVTRKEKKKQHRSPFCFPLFPNLLSIFRWDAYSSWILPMARAQHIIVWSIFDLKYFSTVLSLWLCPQSTASPSQFCQHNYFCICIVTCIRKAILLQKKKKKSAGKVKSFHCWLRWQISFLVQLPVMAVAWTEEEAEAGQEYLKRALQLTAASPQSVACCIYFECKLWTCPCV